MVWLPARITYNKVVGEIEIWVSAEHVVGVWERELGKDRALWSQLGSPRAVTGFRLQALLSLEAGLCLCVQNVP